MGSGMKKTEVKEWVELLKESLEQNVEIPAVVVVYPNELLRLHDALSNELKELLIKAERALKPVSGQRLTPEKILEEFAFVLQRTHVLLNFSSLVLFRQKHELLSLIRKQPEAAQAAHKKIAEKHNRQRKARSS